MALFTNPPQGNNFPWSTIFIAYYDATTAGNHDFSYSSIDDNFSVSVDDGPFQNYGLFSNGTLTYNFTVGTHKFVWRYTNTASHGASFRFVPTSGGTFYSLSDYNSVIGSPLSSIPNNVSTVGLLSGIRGYIYDENITNLALTNASSIPYPFGIFQSSPSLNFSSSNGNPTTWPLYTLSPCFAGSFSRARYWYFGTNAGLDFSTEPPTALTNGALNTIEGCAAISDASGNLLFYTDGSSVWNRNHVTMPNGTGLNGNASSTQSAIIVPKPGSATNYYIFTSSLQGGLGIYYSEVDMSLNGGLGDLVTKNTQLYAGPMAEKLAAIDHANGTNYWIVTRGGNGTNRLYVNEITSAGVQAGSTYDIGTTTNAAGIGALSFSPDGTRLAAALWDGEFELYNFNKTTGAITNLVSLPNGAGNRAYGVCFSSNNNVLYGSEIDTVNGVVYQWDLTAADIPASRIVAGTPSVVVGWGYRGGALQLATNGKIYVAQRGSTFLGVIESPNVVGLGCNFQNDAQTLGGRTCQLGLPPFIQSFSNVDSNCVSPCDTSRVYWGSVLAAGSPDQSITMPVDLGQQTITVALSSPTANDNTTASFFSYAAIPCSFKNPNTVAARTNWDGAKTWTFSQPITNPALAIYSLGNGGARLSLTTSASSWKILCNANSPGSRLCISPDGTTIQGQEGFGIVVFPGTYNSITITSNRSEYYTNYAWGAVGTTLLNEVSCEECFPPPPAPPLSSECVSINFPRGMRPSGGILGNSVETATITVKNTGTTTWTTGQLFRLGCQDPQDNSNWGTCRVELPSALPVPPDANVTFTFPVTAPALSGTYPFSWKMLSEAAPGGLSAWFGSTCTKLVRVENICSSPLTFTPVMLSSCNDFLNDSVYKNLSADECVGNTRSTINQNFFSIQQTLTLMQDTIPYKYKNGLNSVFREYGVSLCPSVDINIESIDSDDCLGDSRITINNNIINTKNVIDELHFIINFFSEPIYSFTDTNELLYALIPENECIGDSLDRLNYLFDYIKNLLSEICVIVDVPAFTPTPTPTPTITPTNTPTCTNERDDILERFALQGEGGYAWNTFNFVDRDKMYVSEDFANSRYPSVIGGSPAAPAAYYTTYDYTTAIGGTTYYGLSGILRFCAGNANNAAIFRDGRVFWFNSATPGADTKVHPWIQSNVNQFKDLFMPSSYRANFVQIVLMKNGELRKLDLNDATEETNPPIVVGLDNTVSPAVNKTLNDVTKIVQINQAHNADCIVACADDSVWHVVIANGNYAPAGEIAARRIKNLKASEIQFAMIGDPGDSCFVVLKNDIRKIYRLNNSGRNLETFAWLTERSLTPVNLNPFTYYSTNTTNLLEPDEYFIDGSSNEFHFTFLTNKYVHCFKAGQHNGKFPASSLNRYKRHTLLPSQQPSLKMVTATSYAMAVELADGFYLLSSNGIANYETAGSDGEYYKAYQNMEKIQNWTNLANILAPLRGLVPFDTSCPIVYTPPPTSPPYQPTPTPTPTTTSTSTPSQTPTPSTCIPLEGEKFIDVGETLKTCNYVDRSDTNIIVKGSFWVDNTIKVQTLRLESGSNLYVTGFIHGSISNNGGVITNDVPPLSATYLCCDV